MIDKNTEKIIALKLKRTKAALEKNNMKAFIANTKKDAMAIAKELINKGDVIGSGGSMTLEQSGIIDILRCGDYKLLDRKNYAPETLRDFFIECFNADAYFTSANAITENGELYNVDGNSNRIAAIAYGPKSVIVVAGYNKIVKNLDDAAKRVKEIAAPTNAVRLEYNTYCTKNGECTAFTKESCPEMTDGCGSDERICCNYLISAKQRHKDRIKVILVAESLGY